ncbi:MAG: hypothetical protein V4467_02720 [Patescibacteria group bacterium]
MRLVQVLWFYILWHYTKSWQDVFRVISNYLWFVSNYFSIQLLSRTLFSPWRRLSLSGGKGQEDSFVGALLVNTIMRVVGFLIRSLTIFAGCIALLLSVFVAGIFLILWLIFPVAVFFLFFGGLGKVLQGLLG